MFVWFYNLTWGNFILLSFLGILIVWFLKTRKHNLSIPGPYALPIIGNLHQLGPNLHEIIHKMRKQHGDIFQLQMGQQTVIVVSGRKYVNEVLTTQSAKFGMRPESFFAKYLSNGKSFGFAPIPLTEHKKFKTISITALKKTEKHFSTFIRTEDPSSSTNNLTLDELFSHEASLVGKNLVELTKDYEAKFKSLDSGIGTYKDAAMQITSRSSIKLMTQIIMGKRYEDGTKQLQVMSNFLRGFLDLQFKISILSSFPILEKIWLSPIRQTLDLVQAMNKYISDHIELAKSASKEEGKDASPTSHSVIQNVLEMIDNGDHIDDEMLFVLINDLFGASVDTASVLPVWFFIYLAVYPEKQKKAQIEIDDFVEKHGRLPCYDERFELPYVLSLLTEVTRHSCFVPFTLPHSPAEDTALGGYRLPRGATLFVSLMSLNLDPDVFAEPEKFRPERFITEDMTFNKPLADNVNVHGSGRRLCPGYSISKIQAFVSAATYLRKFEFRCIDQDRREIPKGAMAITVVPDEFNVHVSKRLQSE